MNTEKLIKALDACFGLMMQPTYDNTPGLIGKRWSIPACSDADFIKYRAEAERLYYESRKEFQDTDKGNTDVEKLAEDIEDLKAKFFRECLISASHEDYVWIYVLNQSLFSWIEKNVFHNAAKQTK